jgi:uncharacterized ion transporter superfamily protein YfcC
MAMLAAAGVSYQDWLRLALPLLGFLVILAAAGVVLGVAVGLS